jgi:hypothetical protein
LAKGGALAKGLFVPEKWAAVHKGDQKNLISPQHATA